MARLPPSRDVAPTVQRLRLRYAKRGRLRFSSHRDFQRALERALRRAEIPMAFSAGFSPHPKVSYANSAPTGVASEAEYVEIGVTMVCDPAAVCRALDEALPAGLDIVEVVAASTTDFVARLEASIWSIELPDLGLTEVAVAVATFLGSTEVTVDRMTKNGLRSFDARQAVVSLVANSEAGCVILRAVVRHVTPSVRPDDVLAALRQVAGLVPQTPPRVTRLAQGPLDLVGATVGDPFTPDRAT